MGVIIHVVVFIFVAIVALFGVLFVVIDMFGRVDYLKTKFPSLERILERKAALGILILVAILLLIGDGYELVQKEIPESPALVVVPKAPPVPQFPPAISQLPQPIGRPAIHTKDHTNTTLPQSASQPPTPIDQRNTIQSQVDMLIETNKHLAKGDRERLADALFDFAKVLDQANVLWGKANQEGAQLNQAWRSGSIVKDFEAHRNALREIDSSARNFAKSFPQVRGKWKYYPDQTNYIFGDNPDNDGPNRMINAVDEYSSYLDRWLTIQNKEERQVLNLFDVEQNDFNEAIVRFAHWTQDCGHRLEQMKNSIQ